MKKLLFIAALGAAGLTNAKEIKKENTSVKNKEAVTENQDLERQVKIAILLRNWIGVSTWCGKVFYLDADDYSSDEELYSAASYFTGQQCATTQLGTGF